MTNQKQLNEIKSRLERYKKALLGSNNKFELFNARTELETHCFSDLVFLLEGENQQWIPVTDRMPEKEETVLVAFDDGFICTVTIDDLGDWELWADSGEPTHWMPQPEPPKKDEVENKMTAEERLKNIKDSLEKEYSARDYQQWRVSNIASLRLDAKFLLQQLTESRRREKAAVMDLKLLADAVRMEHCDDSCCFACMHDADFSIGTSGDFINECPGFSIDKCFEWRGVKGVGSND